ncbi:MAG: hypothetical protein UW63_C0093G0007 [Candidatus Uhrbacteria bacterium GW2011_GWF2_44_350]|uniref:Uncharacterized protein n=1 Tax=Candidatus Uhrbacteria bacterium GW2011_GWF2_44_350 TaxID=1619000 RepID=A0A0G1LGP6_9BACT|nr:MAG: hypothetical protein UW63_C0093G0007 [Candidatus Uhrbacteria bacterium GW2011_GWF2_44_350]
MKNEDYFGTKTKKGDHKPTKQDAVYIVMGKLPTQITYLHSTYSEAAAEANRLCKKEGKIFRVFAEVAIVEPGDPVLTKVE